MNHAGARQAGAERARPAPRRTHATITLSTGVTTMGIPQAILDALNNVESTKEADDGAIADVQAKATAKAAADAALAASQSAQVQTDANLTQSLQQLQAIIAAYYVPGGALPAPQTPPPAPTGNGTDTTTPPASRR